MVVGGQLLTFLRGLSERVAIIFDKTNYVGGVRQLGSTHYTGLTLFEPTPRTIFLLLFQLSNSILCDMKCLIPRHKEF